MAANWRADATEDRRARTEDTPHLYTDLCHAASGSLLHTYRPKVRNETPIMWLSQVEFMSEEAE